MFNLVRDVRTLAQNSFKAAIPPAKHQEATNYCCNKILTELYENFDNLLQNSGISFISLSSVLFLSKYIIQEMLNLRKDTKD